jgi:Cu/Ag efflux pump CusA
LYRKREGDLCSNGNGLCHWLIIKQADENMDQMKASLTRTTDYFARIYPDIEFSVSRNQTELLDYTISNLQQNLSLGFLFICIVAVLFLGDVKSPFIIGLSMVVSIVISFCFSIYATFFEYNLLSGLILHWV